MAIYLSRKKGSGSATPITPSNSNPATLTANSAVSPTANGYAIASYDSVTPSGTPTSVSSGDIVKIGGSGVVMTTPSSITPSNSSPATITSGSTYTATASGKAVASVTDVTPSHTPTSVATNDVVKIGGSGVIVDSLPTIQSSKSVTATTSQQTVGPDTGYDAITEIVVNPQEHSAFFVPLQNEPYNDMGVHNNYRYVDTSGMVIPHPISPSNSNPVSVAPSYPIEYTANGYAIESYSSITPSNSSPATITSGNIYTATANGKAVSSVTDITPSNSSPVALTANTPVNPTASGYAISSYSSKTPSDSSPASVSSGAIIKPSSAGYLYASSGLKKVKTGTFTMSSTSGTVDTVTLGFQPKYICMYNNPTGTPTLMSVYDENFSTTKWIRVSSTGITVPNIGNSQNFNINSITSTGFTTKAYNGASVRYFAIG